MAYERINWQNGEAGNTPLNANNLNRMDMTLEEHDQKIGDHDYEIENLKTGEQGITEEINKKMDRINPQGSGTLSIPAVNADNITAQTVEADEIKVTKVGSKDGTAPVVFDNDILVNGITTPIGSLASSASAKAESAERIANEADRTAGTAKTTASTAYSRVQENIFRTDKLEGIVGGGVGESIPQYTYYDGKYLRPDGEIANYNDSARVIEFEINKNSDSGCNVIFKNVDLIPTDASILCGFYNAAGILLGEEMRGLIIMADFDEDTGKMTRQYISYCVVPAPYYAKYVRISGIANGAVDIAIQNTLSDAVAELQSRSTSALVLTNPSPLLATDGKKILGIDAKGKSEQTSNLFVSSGYTSGRRLSADVGQTYGSNLDFVDADASTMYVSALIEVAGNGTYTRFSYAENYLYRTAFYNASKVRIGKTESKTFTVPSDCKYVAMCGYISELSATTLYGVPTPTNPIPIVDASEVVTASNEDGTESNTITLPYTLRSVGTVADELIVNEDGSGKLIRRVGEIVINGSENWTKGANGFYSSFNDVVKLIDYRGYLLSDRFVVATNNNTLTDGQISAFADSSNSYPNENWIYIRYDACTNANELKTWLASNNVTVYFARKTPIETPLTPEEVASIRQLQTYKGTTVIDSEMDVVSVTYSGDVKGYVDSKTDYSYTDTIIGKWADGKDLHRMVVNTNTPSSSGGIVIPFLNGNNCDIKNMYGFINWTSDTKVPINYYSTSTNFATTYPSANGIVMSMGNSLINKPCEIIVEYTLKDSAPAAASVLSIDETEE